MKFYLYLFLLFFCTRLCAQPMTPIAFDLASPIDVNIGPEGNPWVTNVGTGNNDGQVIRVLADGTKEVIISNLPSFFNEEVNEMQGPLSTSVLADGRIMLCQGAGPDTLSATIMEFHWEDYQSGTPLTLDDRRNTVYHGNWVLAQGYAESNPYSMLVEDDGSLVIADAAANAVVRYLPDTESFSVIADLPSFPNPTPVGPPSVEQVPTKVLAHPDGGYWVSTLTGFPFLDGGATIFHLLPDGTLTPYATGLTLLTDLDVDPNDGGLLALQFAAFGPVGDEFGFQFGSAQLLKVQMDGSLDTLATGFGPSPGLAITADGTAYFSHLFLGQLLRYDGLATGLFSPPAAVKPLKVFPNPTQGQVQLQFQLAEAGEIQYQLFDVLGRQVQAADLGYFPSGEQQLQLLLSHSGLLAGTYQVVIRSGKRVYTASLILQ